MYDSRADALVGVERGEYNYESRIEKLYALANKLDQKVQGVSLSPMPTTESNEPVDALSPLNKSPDQVVAHFEDVISRIQL